MPICSKCRQQYENETPMVMVKHRTEHVLWCFQCITKEILETPLPGKYWGELHPKIDIDEAWERVFKKMEEGKKDGTHKA